MWQLFLAESDDLSIVCPLPRATGISLELTLNRPGRLNFNYPLGDPNCEQIAPVYRCILLVKDGQIVWSGPIGPIAEALPSEQINVVATGWLETLYKRQFRNRTVYTDETRGTIIHSLLNVANGYADTYITAGIDGDDAPTISKTFELFENIGQGVEQMTSLEASPDISVDPVTRTLDIRAWDSYSDHPNVVWAYNCGPNNLESFGRTIDSDAMVNRINVLGKNSNTTVYIAEDLVSQATYNLYESNVTLSSVSDPEVIAAYAEAEIVYRGTPRVTYSFQPRGGVDMPLIWEDFQLGDMARLKAQFPPRIDVEQNIRIFSVTLQIDENNDHKLTNITTIAA